MIGMTTAKADASRPPAKWAGRPVLQVALILVVSFVPVALAAAAASPTQKVDLEAIDAYIAEQMRAHRIPGLALTLIHDGAIVGMRGYGRADSSGREMTPQTPVIMGSLSKAFTALAVMQLVEAGHVELDAPVQRYLPWFTLADREASAGITVRHLLNQTSGIPNAVGLELCVGTGEATIEEQARALKDVTPAFAPGTRFQYSNANYLVAGALVEAVAAESYGEYVRSHIFEPLQMEDSFVSQREAEEHGLATGYRRWFGFPLPSDPPYLPDGLPSGYLIASAEDIGHFLVANLSGGVYEGSRVLSAEGMAELHAPAVDAGDARYAMGWVVGDVAGLPAVYHHGSTPSFHSTMLMEPAGRRGVVVVTNVNLFEMWHVGPSSVIAEGVLQLLRGEPAPTGGPSIGARYLVADLIALAFTGLTVLFIALMPRWRRRLIARPPRGVVGFGRRVALPILVPATWSVTILLAFPDISNLPSWGFWTLYQPDFAYWLIAIAAVTAVKAVVSAVLAYGAIREAGERPSWWRVVVGSILAEVLFMALFFLAMFTAAGPAMFVMGVLVAALALEGIAHVGRRVS